MNETKIRGIIIHYNDDRIEIYDAYQIQDRLKMNEILTKVIIDKSPITNIHKPFFIIETEWKIRNKLYKFKLLKNKMKDYIITNKINILAILLCCKTKENRKAVKEWLKKKKKR